VDFQVVTNGDVQGVSGTSASTPLVAGVFALLNHVRLEAGLSSMGELHDLPFVCRGLSC
jgi:tripeptidyl-peptidase-1